MSTKDAAWFLESMKKEFTALEKQLEADKPTMKEKAMSDEQYTALMDTLKATTDKVDAVAAQVTTVTDTVTAQGETLEALKPAPVEDKEDEAVEDEKEDDTAKDGGDDQSGADAEEFNPDSELTPEQEAEVRDTLGIAA